MSGSARADVWSVARSALRLYFEPAIKAATFFRRASIESSALYGPRLNMRRVSDRRMYDLAAAFGLVAAVASIVAAVSMWQLARTQVALRSHSINYVIDFQPVREQPSVSNDLLKVSGQIRIPKHILASALPTYEVLKNLSVEQLELFAIVRPNALDGQWVVQGPIKVAADGSFSLTTSMPSECDTDCHIALILVPKGTLKAGDRSLSVPPASAASSILSVGEQLANDG